MNKFTGLFFGLILTYTVLAMASNNQEDFSDKNLYQTYKFNVQLEEIATPNRNNEGAGLLTGEQNRSLWESARPKVLACLAITSAALVICGGFAFAVVCSQDFQSTNGTGWCGGGDGDLNDIPTRNLN